MTQAYFFFARHKSRDEKNVNKFFHKRVGGEMNEYKGQREWPLY